MAFIEKYNDENGRGGQSAAAKKYKLNPITVRSWMEKAGVATPSKSSKSSKRKKRAGRKVSAAPSRNASAPKSPSAALKRMVKLQEQIEALQAEYDSLKLTL